MADLANSKMEAAARLAELKEILPHGAVSIPAQSIRSVCSHACRLGGWAH